MKQKISIRGIIKKDGKTLLVRRGAGRPSILGKYELPGGSLHFNEQPQDALKRYIQDYLDGQVETAQLSDVLSFIDPDDPDTQYVFIVYIVSLQNDKLSPKNRYDKYIWQEMREIQHNLLTHSTVLLLKLNGTDTTEGVNSDINIVGSTSDSTIIYSDGGSRGNPGPSASAFVIMDANEQLIASGGVYLGVTTNNQAEYQAVYQALKKAKEIGVKEIDFRLDSNLVVSQLNGVYKIKNRDLWPIYQDIKDMTKDFEKISFTHVRREFNHIADGLVNKILDDHRAHSSQ